MADIVKIVLTEGPCRGKTTALTKVVEYFEKHREYGVGVVFVPKQPPR